MANNKNNPRNAQSELFKRLTRLLSGPIINYKTQTSTQEKRRALDKYKFTSASGHQFKRLQYNPFDNIAANLMVNQNRAQRYADFSQMEFTPEIACITGDTMVATLEGFIKIKDLVEKYSNGQSFEVWAWDSERNQYTIGNATYPRETGIKEIIEVVLDNGKSLHCTADHRIMLKDGTYKQAGDLQENDCLMSFDYNITSSEYMNIRTPNKGKYKKAHRYIYENIFEKYITPNNNIHHINENKLDNRISNLVELTALEHTNIHKLSPQTNVKKSKALKELWNDSSYRQAALSGLRKWQKSEKGKRFISERTSFINKERWSNDIEYAEKMVNIFSMHAKSLWTDLNWKAWKRKHHSETMKLKYANDPSFKEKTKNIDEKNGRFLIDITTDSILIEGQKYDSFVRFAEAFDFKQRKYKTLEKKLQFLRSRLQTAGFKNWADYKENYVYNNHKVVKILATGQKEKVYDLTVEHYENFCLENGLIISNSALDIYADEMTTSTYFQPMLDIKCPNEELKTILNNLYYNIMNIEHNLFNWCRAMCKEGDYMLYLDIDENVGIKNVIGLPAVEMERLEGEDKTNPNYVQFQWNSGGITFENWQICHFRILGNEKLAPYGTSVLEPARRIWRQLCIAKGENITTPTGFTPIEKLKSGDSIYCYDPDTKQIKETTVIAQKHMGKQNIYNLSTNHRNIKVTDKHGMLVQDYKTNEYVYKQAKEIVIGKDKLPLTVIKGGSYAVDKRFARLFGFLLGDGWIINPGIEFVADMTYENLLEDLSKTNVFSQEFKEILEAAEFETGTLPEWIYSMDIENRREFIRGCFDACGDYSDGGMTSISYSLLEGIKEIAMMSGVPCKPTIENKLHEDGSFRQAAYRIYLNMNEEQWNDETVLETVLSFDFIGEDETFDVQVEDSLHNFIVSGLVSHNTLLEDAMMAYRIVRSPERKVYYIDVGNVAPEDVEQYVQKIITQMKRNQVVDATTGRVDLRYNPMSVEEDIFIPVRGAETGTKVEALPGGTMNNDIEDVKYLRDKLFSALKIPHSYLTRDEGAEEDKTTLAQKDIRFARTIQRLQKSVIAELQKAGIIHLYTLGFRGDELLSFKVNLHNPSKIADMQELEHLRTKFDVANSASEGYFSKRWISQNIFNISDQEFQRNLREMFFDIQHQAQLEAYAEKIASESGIGGMPGGGELGGDMMGLGGPGDSQMDDTDTEEELGPGLESDSDLDLGGTAEAPNTAADDESPLLAAPANRDDGGYLTKTSKGRWANPAKRTKIRKDGSYQTSGSKGKWYQSVKETGGDRRKAGARKRHYKSQWADELSSNTTRNIFKGASELRSLGYGIAESEDVSNYREEENLLLQTNAEIRLLLEELEKNDTRNDI